MEEEIKITSEINGNMGSVHAWKDGKIIMSGICMKYTSSDIECFGSGLDESFQVRSIEEGMGKITAIFSGNIPELRAVEAMARVTESINKNVNTAAHLMSLRIAKFRADLFEQHNNVWKIK